MLEMSKPHLVSSELHKEIFAESVSTSSERIVAFCSNGFRAVALGTGCHSGLVVA